MDLTCGTLHKVQGAIANDPNINWVDLAKQSAAHHFSKIFVLEEKHIIKLLTME